MKRLFLFVLFSFILVLCRENTPSYLMVLDPTSLDRHFPEMFGDSEKSSFCKVLRLAPKGETYSSKCYIMCGHTTQDDMGGYSVGGRSMGFMAPAPCSWLGHIIEIDDGQQFKAPKQLDITFPRLPGDEP